MKEERDISDTYLETFQFCMGLRINDLLHGIKNGEKQHEGRGNSASLLQNKSLKKFFYDKNY